MEPKLPVGVQLRDTVAYQDPRGALNELFRQSWEGAPVLRQWNVVKCEPRTVRGVHVHFRHTDYLIAVSGRFLFGLRDIRSDSPTHGLAATLVLDGARLRALIIPPGVAHGFLCAEGGMQLYGMTHEWDPEDDIACRWDDADLGFRFPIETPILSERDAMAGSLAAMSDAYAQLKQGKGK